MKDHEEKYDEMIDRIIMFGERCERVRSAIVIGSRGRTDVEADEWSDLDIVIFTDDPEYFISDEGWIEDIGDHWLSFLEDTPIGDNKERRVLFEDALDVDFAILSSEEFESLKDDPEIRSTFSKGYKVLVDKDGLFDDIEFDLGETSHPDKYQLPDEGKFDNLVTDFWYHAVWSGKKLLRGEIWVARSCVDGYMKSKLLKMIEWYMVCCEEETVREEGRFFEKWVEERIKTDMKACFAHYDKDDIKRALENTIDLFRGLAEEVADELGYEYDSLGDAKCTEWVEENLLHDERR